MRYRKKGIKREHSIIEDFDKDLELLVEKGLVDSVIVPSSIDIYCLLI